MCSAGDSVVPDSCMQTILRGGEEDLVNLDQCIMSKKVHEIDIYHSSLCVHKICLVFADSLFSLTLLVTLVFPASYMKTILRCGEDLVNLDQHIISESRYLSLLIM